ncbi:MAG: L-threonylcarbamoyladenylate synthase [Candidatus Sumerlaeia bacterium]|nr:L-threonylcarbamoyladenylate synthase [Candidatus Sumerlaeia bacterium]
MQRPLIAVIIGGRVDFNVMRRGLETLRVMGVPYIFEVLPPHRNPQKLAEFALNAGENGIEVLIVAEGGSSMIASHLAAYTTLPIIGVPIDASPLRGQDALFSLAMLPPGLPVATVGINNSENAALLATQILALKHVQFRTVLAHRRMSSSQRAEGIYQDLCNEYPDLCLRERTAPLRPSPDSNETDDPRNEASESITPEPPEPSERIRPGATYIDRPPTRVESLVSTPVPQEPGVISPFGSYQPFGGNQLPPPTAEMILKGALDPSPKPIEPVRPSSTGVPRFSTASMENETISDLEDVPSSKKVSEEPTAPQPTIIRHHSPVEEDQNIPQKPSFKKGASVATELAKPKRNPDEDSDGAIPETKQPNASSIKTKIFKVNRDNPNDDLVDHAMMVLLEGGIVGLPTDTVYGLAADATNDSAVEKLYSLKGKDTQKTLGVMIHHPDMLDGLVSEVPAALEKVIEECWPGALTIILPKLPSTLKTVTSFDRIGVRIPSDKLCLSVIERVGRPLVVRNASNSTTTPINSAEPMIESFNGLIDCILDGGDCASSAGASTVLTALGDQFEILREGGVTRKRLKDLLGSKLKDPG